MEVTFTRSIEGVVEGEETRQTGLTFGEGQTEGQ